MPNPRTRGSAPRAAMMRCHVSSVLASSTNTSSHSSRTGANAAATSRAMGSTLSASLNMGTMMLI